MILFHSPFTVHCGILLNIAISVVLFYPVRGTSTSILMMKNAKKVKRPLRNKNKSDSLEKKDESDTDIQTEEETSKEKETEMASKKINADALASDFKLQSEVYLNRLEEVHEQSVQDLRTKYKKIFLTVEKDILDLTLNQFHRLQQSFLQELNAINVQEDDEELPGEAQQRQITQSPNVTSSKRTGSSRERLGASLEADKAPPVVVVQPEAESDESEDDFDDAQSNGDLQPMNTDQPKLSALVPFTPPSNGSASLLNHGTNHQGSIFTGMPLLNLFIPVSNGMAVTVLPQPVTNFGPLPEISPSIMRGLKIIQSNISVLTKAWEKQQKRSLGRKSIISGSSRK
ncbi:uncharacterized protein LOC135948621 [Cloeon dipterum]|uniref:uncharacterized protein LOC135948621 n=1 Tax=Cloeon dipterum TaxID=197152 RepID=UPI003220572A